MTRTTLDIAQPLLRQIKAIGREDGRSLGKVVSELLGEALARRAGGPSKPATIHWISGALQARADWADTESLETLLERDDQEKLAGHSSSVARQHRRPMTLGGATLPAAPPVNFRPPDGRD